MDWDLNLGVQKFTSDKHNDFLLSTKKNCALTSKENMSFLGEKSPELFLKKSSYGILKKSNFSGVFARAPDTEAWT